jgi:peptidoglycan/xylan/chitin deacetylase (PgdA/CDA1 family)
MKKLIALIVVIVFLALSSFLWQIGKSRTFQFFGEIIPRVNTTQKVVALTFDDGPVPGGTEEILSILGQEQIHCTFFLTGAELERNMEQGKRIVAAGHEVGNHTYSHVRMLLVTPSFVKQEIESTDKLIRQAGYQGEILFRPPFGKKLFALPYYLSKNGRKTITWDVEPNSFPEIDASSDKIVEYVLQKTQPGSIIILHVMYSNRKESMKAVKGIIDGLKSRGYSFKTVSELLATAQ